MIAFQEYHYGYKDRLRNKAYPDDRCSEGMLMAVYDNPSLPI